MKKNLTLLSASIALSLTSLATQASSFDTRSFAMGGIGASTADYLTAPFHNPALVARYNENDNFGLLLPSLGAGVQAGEDTLTNIDDAASAIDKYEQGDFTSVNQVQSEIIEPLARLDGETANASGGAGIAFAMPQLASPYSLNIYAQSYARIHVISEVDEDDLDPNSYINISSGTFDHEFNSNVTGLGVLVSEFGVSVARSYQLEQGLLYVGVTPKIQNLTALNYTATVNDYEFGDTLDENVNDKTALNMDLGAAFALDNGVTLGLVGKNIFSQSLTSKEDQGKSVKYTLNGVYTASASYQTELFTVGADIDLNKSKNISSYNGFSASADATKDDTQMFGIGAEFNAWKWAQLRVGYNMDLQGNLDNEISAGIGLSPFDVVHLDFSVSYAGDSQFGASIQTYFTF